jgi:hypothetical protein
MKLKCQWGIMEYIFATIVFIILITSVIFFLSWWQITQMERETKTSTTEKSLYLIKRFTNSPFFVKESDVFDEAKLFSLMGRCEELQELFGGGWFAEIRIFDGNEQDILCGDEYDGSCNYFSFCKEAGRDYSALPVPVNVYRKIGYVFESGLVSRTYPGVLKVGIYNG